MGYPTKKLGDICDIQNGYAFKAKDYIENGEVRIIRIGNVQKGFIGDKSPCFVSSSIFNEFKNFSINENDILISLTGDVGRVGLFPKKLLPSLLNQRVGRFINIDNEKIYFKFLFNYLNTKKFEEEVIKSSSGAAQKNTSTSKIKEIKIPIPPLPTQKLIVQKLDQSFEKIDKSIELTKNNLKNIEELNKSVLEEFFTEGKYDKVDLLTVANFHNKGILPNNKDLYNYIGLENIESNTGRLVNFNKTEGLKIKSNKVSFLEGMVLYGKLRPYLNKVLVTEFDGVATTEILPIKCGSKLYNHFLGNYLRTDYFVNIANSNVSGARMPRVTTLFLKSLKIPLPSLEKQKEIVAQLDKVFEKNKVLKEKYLIKLKDLEEMKQSLLKEAFEGRLVEE